jgi:hypothetical protein
MSGGSGPSGLEWAPTGRPDVVLFSSESDCCVSIVHSAHLSHRTVVTTPSTTPRPLGLAASDHAGDRIHYFVQAPIFFHDESVMRRLQRRQLAVEKFLWEKMAGALFKTLF